MRYCVRAWVSFAAACGSLGCSDGSSTNNESHGGAGAGGAVATSGGIAAGGAGARSGSAGESSAGQSTSGAATGGANAGSANGNTSGAGGANAGNAGTGGGSVSMLPQRVLLYHFSTLVIDSVPAQLASLKRQLEAWGYEVEDSLKPDDISAENLARFGGVAMINTCFEPFGAGKTGEAQAAALAAFVENGGGLFGTHCASVTFQAADPPNPYNGVIGGRGGHGFFDGKSACRTTAQHVTTDMLPRSFDFTGNLDNADYVAPDSTVIVKCKWSEGDMTDTAVSWIRTAGKGRVFYTNFAKVDADLRDATVGQKHIFVGLGWALGRF